TLMRKSVAIINPSLFEGWSTTVEEAKSLGKSILLSSIAVHLEQAPKRGLYFTPHDPNELATLLIKTLTAYSLGTEKAYEAEAAASLKARVRDFALTYEKIITTVVNIDT